MGRARAMARQFREQLEIEAADAQRAPPPAAPPPAAPPQDAAPPSPPPTPPPPSAVDDYVRRSDADERREP
jgi:hypothetical protein